MTKVNQSTISPEFTESDRPQFIYDGGQDIYILNEAAYTQIERVADLLAAIASFSEKADHRTEQLYNTLLFSSDLLSQAIKSRFNPAA